MKNIHPEFSFTQGSTPVLAFGAPEGIDLTGYKVWVTFAQNFRTVLTVYNTGSGVKIEDGMIYVYLTKAETAQFNVGDVDAQVHYQSPDGKICDHSNEIYGVAMRTQDDGEDVLVSGTTPTHTFDIGVEQNMVAQVEIVYSQGGKNIVIKDISDCTFSGTEISVELSKVETLLFTPGQMIEIVITVTSPTGDVMEGKLSIRCE